MPEQSFDHQVQYVTNAEGKPTAALVPWELWEEMLGALKESASGLAWIDERESKASLLADLRRSLAQAAADETFSLSDLWSDGSP